MSPSINLSQWEYVIDASNLTTPDESNKAEGLLKWKARHGYTKYIPWWKCIKRVDSKAGAVGCYPHNFDWGDAEELSCDPDTGEGCECEAQEPPGSEFTCEDSVDPDTGGTVKRLIRKAPLRRFAANMQKVNKPPGLKKPKDCVRSLW